MSNIAKFFLTCFDPEDQVWATTKDGLRSKCFARSQPTIKNQFCEKDFPGGAYLAINAGQDRRLISNVSKIRTFLIEFDEMPLTEQIAFWRSVGLPVTAIISSAGKSLHFWMTLEQPLQLGEYKEWFCRISILLNHKNDKQCSDPTRFSRFPGAFRDGKEQKLIGVGARIPNQRLKALLFSKDVTEIFEAQYRPQGSGDVFVRADRIPLETAIHYLEGRYPLVTGEKQANMLAWARYLVGSAGIRSREQLIDILSEYDLGKNPLASEYERVADKVLNSIPQNKTKVIMDDIWSGQ